MSEKKFRMKVVRRAGKARSERVRERGGMVAVSSSVSQQQAVQESAASPSSQLAVYQSTGGSKEGVMSQAAVTSALNALRERIGEVQEVRMGRYGAGATTGVRYRFWLDPGINLTDTLTVTVEKDGESVEEQFVLAEWFSEGEYDTRSAMLAVCLRDCDSHDLLVSDLLLRDVESDGEYIDLTFDADAWGVYATVSVTGAGASDVELTSTEVETGADFWKVAPGRGDLIDGCRKEGVLYVDKTEWKLYCWNASEREYQMLGGEDLTAELAGKADAAVVSALQDLLNSTSRTVSGLTTTVAEHSSALSEIAADGVKDNFKSAGVSGRRTLAAYDTTSKHINKAGGVGSDTRPIYIDGDGVATPCGNVAAATATGDEEGTNIKSNYQKVADALAKFVRYDAAQMLSAVQKSTARTNIDSENLVIGYLARGFTTNIYFTELDGGSPRDGTVVVTANGQGALCVADYTSLSGEQVITYIAECINALNGYSATASLVTGTNAYHAVITVTCDGNPVTGLQFRSGFTGYVFNIETTGAAAGFYADANYSTLVTNTYVARKLYLDLNTNQLYCGNENELQSVAGSPVVDASYDSVKEELTLTFLGDKSVTIPFPMPVLSAGKGIAINGNTISQNYVVCTESELAEYLAQGIDDGLIRYVYEEE